MSRLDSAKIVIETPIGVSYEFIAIEEMTLDDLLDEWYEDDPMIDQLLRSPQFEECSRAYYLTLSHSLKESTLFRFLLELLAEARLPIQVHDCDAVQLAPSEFLEYLDSA